MKSAKILSLAFCFFAITCYSHEFVTSEDAYTVEDIDSKDLAALGITTEIKSMTSGGWVGNSKVTVVADMELFDPKKTRLKVLLAGEDDLLAVIENFNISNGKIVDVMVSKKAKAVLLLEVSEKKGKTRYLRFNVDSD